MICISVVVAIAANLNTDVLSSSSGWANTQGSPATSERTTASKTDLLMREDTKIKSLKGMFTQKHGRWEFLEDGSTKPIKCLENLWLQRIVDAQKSSTRKINWSINATVKEFGSENYLLIDTASKSH